MKKFLAKFMGSEKSENQAKWNAMSETERSARITKGMQAWGNWMKEHQRAIVESGGPLGKTKLVGPKGIVDFSNQDAGYVIVQAESFDAAAKMFIDHPHFTIFPGDSVEVMECLPIPTQHP